MNNGDAMKEAYTKWILSREANGKVAWLHEAFEEGWQAALSQLIVDTTKKDAEPEVR